METVYNKLVRDKIPQVIREAGKEPVFCKIQDPDRIRELLVNKLKEEVEEYCSTQDYQELADILEVIHGLLENVHDTKFQSLEEIRVQKAAKRGGFQEGIYLEKVIT